jgi:predicted O-methyltransferase YrrM|tara:strand:- start:363 stop:1148 length:786 start_codon:yes stop_codon:yes gene_type:complete
MSSFLKRKNLIKSGIGILIRNPKLIINLLNFDKAYCSYFQSKLKYAKKFYEENKFENCDDNKIFEEIKKVNEKILQEFSRNEAYFIPLYFLVRKLKPNLIIETGVHRGVSSLFILQALKDNNKGELYSIDLPLAKYDTDSGESTKSLLAPEKVGICIINKLKERWNLILGDSKKELPKLLSSVQSCDMFIHDSKHTYEHMEWEFNIVWSNLNQNGVLVSDDTNWNSSFRDFASKVGRKNMELIRDKNSESTFGIILKNNLL